MIGDRSRLELGGSDWLKEYRRFIRFALKYADCLGLSYTGDLSAFKESKWWEMFAESFIRHEYDEDGDLTVYLKIDHVAVEWLKSKRDIFDFWDTDADENFLWDLCLYKDGEEIFTTVTHERLQYISQKLNNEYLRKSK